MISGTPAERLHAQGVSPFTIQEILGHSQLVPTRRYTHVNTALQKAGLDKVGELLGKPQGTAKNRSVHEQNVLPRALAFRHVA